MHKVLWNLVLPGIEKFVGAQRERKHDIAFAGSIQTNGYFLHALFKTTKIQQLKSIKALCRVDNGVVTPVSLTDATVGRVRNSGAKSLLKSKKFQVKLQGLLDGGVLKLGAEAVKDLEGVPLVCVDPGVIRACPVSVCFVSDVLVSEGLTQYSYKVQSSSFSWNSRTSGRGNAHMSRKVQLSNEGKCTQSLKYSP